MDQHMMRKRVAMALAVSVLSATTALAETVWVKSETAEVRTGKAAIYPVVAKPKKGAELTVVASEGKWIKVQIDPQTQGYIFENAISSDKVSGSGGNLL